jgi:DNA-binding transcriptional regulator YhcF (GntR family)
VEEEAAAAGNDSRAPYLHIASVLRREILDGLYQVGERIPSQAELEERFEVSRPTVQRALTELRKSGLIDNQRGRPAEVQPWHGPGRAAGSGEPEPAYASLGAYVAEAFEQRHITVDAFSLTTETLFTALTAQLQRIARNEVHPASIRVRVLLPSQDARLAIPKLVADPADERPLRRLRQLVRAHVISLRSAFTALSDVHPDIQHEIEFCTVPLTPTSKVYVLNGRTALFGYYQVVERSVQFGNGDRAPIYDVLGVNAILFAHRAGADGTRPGDQRFVAETQAWFDSLWQSIAEPLRLFE